MVLQHWTTIGVDRTQEFGSKAVPVIGEDVDIGSNVIILGSIRIGDRVKIFAGSVVISDIPDAIAVGNSARVIFK